MKRILKKIDRVTRACKEFLQFALFLIREKNCPYRFTLKEDRLFTREIVEVKNSRINVIKWGQCSSKNAHLIDHDAYLLIFYENNLAHFFHDIFFPVYFQWRKNPKIVFASINENEFLRDFLSAVFGNDNVIFTERASVYKFKRLSIGTEGRDLKVYPDYLTICKEIKNRCLHAIGVAEHRTKNILYSRTELKRKNLINLDQNFLSANQIESHYLSRLSFKDLVSILAQTKTFTYMVGAGVFYLLFLDESVPTLEINPARNNSWAEMFGMSKLCDFSVFVSNNIQSCMAAAQGDPILDSHVFFDDQIKQEIIKIINKV